MALMNSAGAFRRDARNTAGAAQEPPRREAPRRQAAGMRDEAFERAEKLKKKARHVRRMHSLQAALTKISVAGYVLLTILVILVWLMQCRDALHVPVTYEEVVAETEALEDDWDVSYKYSYTKDGISYYAITVGEWETVQPESALDAIGMDTKVHCTVYRTTLSCEGSLMQRVLCGGKVETCRFSIFGEEEFSPSELQRLREGAAERFTHKVYASLLFKDADDYATDDW